MTTMQELFDRKGKVFYTSVSGGYDMEEQLGDRIRAIRERYGMPASVLAKRVGISRQQLNMIERNETTNPGALTVLHIAEALGVSTDYLLKGKRKTRRLTDDVEREPTELAPV
jgi:transcriptional regulator with XRE-family HTH domain